MEELVSKLKQYWWVGAGLFGLFFLVALPGLISRRPTPPQKIEIRATPKPTPKIINNPVSIVTVDDLTFNLPSWVVWGEDTIKPREPLQTMLVGTDWAKDMPGKIYRGSTIEQDFPPSRLGDDLQSILGKHGFTTISVEVERSENGKKFVLKPNKIEDEEGATEGVVWSDGKDVRYVGWSHAIQRHNKASQTWDVDYEVFVSKKVGVLEVLNAVRLK